ncbi:unnamed protein product, partial [Heterosigma akashiwo]
QGPSPEPTAGDEDAEAGITPMLDSAALAQEVMELLEQKCGATFYLEIYTKVKKEFDDKRMEKKKAQATEAVKNPEKAAKRKIQRNLEKRENKKRKMERNRNVLHKGKHVNGRKRPLESVSNF